MLIYLFQLFVFISLVSTPIILFIFFIREIAKTKLSASIYRAFWIVVMVRLLVPVNFSVYRASNAYKFGIVDISKIFGTGIVWECLSYIWAAGIIWLIIYYTINYFRVKRRIFLSGVELKHSNPYIPKDVVDADHFTVMCCRGFRIPFVFRIWNPIIVLPYDMVKAVSGKSMESVVYHELIHIKRKDTMLLFIALTLRCVYWFNPFVHLAFSRMKVDQDIACDEIVAGRATTFEAEKYIYALQTVGARFERIPFGISQFCETSLGKRSRAIKLMASGNKRDEKKAVFAIIAVSIVTIGVSFLTALI